MEDLMAACKLRPNLAHFFEVDRQTAQKIIVRILYADLAYNTPGNLPLDRAVELADAFLDDVGTEKARYLTNGEAREPSGGDLKNVVAFGAFGDAGGGATFEWCVAVLTEQRSGVLYVGDED